MQLNQVPPVPFVLLVNSYLGRSNPQTRLQKGNMSMQGLELEVEGAIGSTWIHKHVRIL